MSTLAAIALVPITAVTAVGVDAGRVFVERQRVQTAAESSALAAAADWYRTGSPGTSGTPGAPGRNASNASDAGASNGSGTVPGAGNGRAGGPADR